MSEWLSVILIFWGLWLADGWKIATTALHHVAGRGRRARLIFGRFGQVRFWPTGWQTQVADIPFALSPAGLCNRPVGAVGRPTETPHLAQAWAWADITQAEAKDGWLFVNGRRFCRDTGHLPAGQLLALAKLDPAARAARLAWWLHRWLRPAHLRRRARVLMRRTETVVTLNGALLLVAAGLSVHFAGYGGYEPPATWIRTVERTLPLLGAYFLFFHVAAMGLAIWAARKLKPVRPSKRGTNLFTAAMLPAQALRLRALLAEAYFPVQHPLAYALAFARPCELAAVAFQVLGDLRWPIDGRNDSALAGEICSWHRRELTGLVRGRLAAAGVAEEKLFAAPVADASGGCRYCPRCLSQFSDPAAHCSHGIELQPVRPSAGPGQPP